MEKKKTNNKLVVLLLLVIVCLLAGCGFLTYTLISDDSNLNLAGTGSSNSQISGDETDDNNLPEWVDYLLKQNITEISYYPGNLDDNNECIVKTMTKEQLTEVLTRMTSAPLKKYKSGGGGGPCYSGIEIVAGDKEYEIWNGNTMSKYGMDEHGLSLLEKEKYTLVDEEITVGDWYYEYEWDMTYLYSLFADTNTSLLKSVDIKNAEVKK